MCVCVCVVRVRVRTCALLWPRLWQGHPRVPGRGGASPRCPGQARFSQQVRRVCVCVCVVLGVSVPEAAPCFSWSSSSPFASTPRHAWVSPHVSPLGIDVRVGLCVRPLAALVDLPRAILSPFPWVSVGLVRACVCVRMCVCVHARVHAYTLLLGPGVSPPGPGTFCACLSVSVMANRVLVAGPYPGPWLVSSLCGLQVWLWSSQSCSVVACPEPHAASLPISSSLPAPTSPAHGDVPAWSLGRLLNAPFLSPSWTEPGLTAQPPSQKVWLPGNSMESNIQTGPLRKSSDLGLLRGAPSFSEPGREPPQMCSPQGARRVGTGEQGGNDLPYPIGGY